MVSVAPKVSADKKYGDCQKVKEGSMFILQANLVGAKGGKCTWLLNGKPVEDLPNVTVDTTPETSTLTVKKSNMKNAGKYELILENDVGTDSLAFDVDIIGLYHGINSR